MSRIVLLTAVFMTIVTSCTERGEREPALSEDELVEIYFNVSLIRESDLGNTEKESRILRYIESTGWSWEDVSERISYYQANPDRWRSFYEKVKQRIDESPYSK